MNAPLLVIAAGGTGGHMFPAQALAEEMLSDGWRVKLSTDSRGNRYSGNFPTEVKREVVEAATFSRGGFAAKIRAPFQILAGILSTWKSMKSDPPAVVIGFGGYPALPAITAAWALGLPRMVHEQNGVLGRVNALFAKRVETVACSVWPTELPGGTNAVHTGNPVRSAVRALAAAPYEVGDRVLNVLVIGGSQGASILSEQVPKALADLPPNLRDRLVISHQARDTDLEEVVSFYKAKGISAEVKTFFDDVPERLVKADLVISRSGASSVADIAAIGRPSILVPLAAAIRDEQTANAKGLVDAGAAILVTEMELHARLRFEVEGILNNPEKAKDMAEAASKQGRPDAVDRLKAEVLKLVRTT